MDSVQEVDSVLQSVRQVARRFRVPQDATITQQVLLFGNAFYGYRFEIAEFLAVWSAAEQALKVYNHDGKVIEIISTADEHIPETSSVSEQRKVA